MSTEHHASGGASRAARLFQSVPDLLVLRRYNLKEIGPDALSGLVIWLV